jgi:hypothetical protein
MILPQQNQVPVGSSRAFRIAGLWSRNTSSRSSGTGFTGHEEWMHRLQSFFLSRKIPLITMLNPMSTQGEEVAAPAQQLTEMSKTLQAVVSRFKLSLE